MQPARRRVGRVTLLGSDRSGAPSCSARAGADRSAGRHRRCGRRRLATTRPGNLVVGQARRPANVDGVDQLVALLLQQPQIHIINVVEALLNAHDELRTTPTSAHAHLRTSHHRRTEKPPATCASGQPQWSMKPRFGGSGRHLPVRRRRCADAAVDVHDRRRDPARRASSRYLPVGATWCWSAASTSLAARSARRSSRPMAAKRLPRRARFTRRFTTTPRAGASGRRCDADLRRHRPAAVEDGYVVVRLDAAIDFEQDVADRDAERLAAAPRRVSASVTAARTVEPRRTVATVVVAANTAPTRRPRRRRGQGGRGCRTTGAPSRVDHPIEADLAVLDDDVDDQRIDQACRLGRGRGFQREYLVDGEPARSGRGSRSRPGGRLRPPAAGRASRRGPRTASATGFCRWIVAAGASSRPPP